MQAAPRTRLLALSRTPLVARVLDTLRSLTRAKPLQRVAEDGLKRLAQRVRGVADLLDPPAKRSAVESPPPSVSAPEAPVAEGPSILAHAPIDELALGLSANDMSEQISTIEALTIRPEPEAVDSLISALRSTDAEVSIAAIAGLVARDDADGAQALIDVIDDRSGFFLPITRLAAARALQQFTARPPQGVQAVLAKEYDDQVRDVLYTLA